MSLSSSLSSTSSVSLCSLSTCSSTSGSRTSSLSDVPDLDDWLICQDDLEVDEVIHRGPYGEVFKGRFYDEVLIYTFPECKEVADVDTFLTEVSSMSRLRHENLQLFMGATITPIPSIITAIKKGSSLHQTLHISKQSLSLSYRISISRQIAQAVSYLHSKGVVVQKRFSSHNIILEHKVKLCLIDQQVMSSECTDHLPHQLSYLSPELMRSLEMKTTELVIHNDFTEESDVYAFGTILYELFTYRFPFDHLKTDSMIYKIGSGHHESLSRLTCDETIKVIVSKCWHSNPQRRPSFKKLVKKLSRPVTSPVKLNRSLSSSEPEKLNALHLMSFPSF